MGDELTREAESLAERLRRRAREKAHTATSYAAESDDVWLMLEAARSLDSLVARVDWQRRQPRA